MTKTRRTLFLLPAVLVLAMAAATMVVLVRSQAVDVSPVSLPLALPAAGVVPEFELAADNRMFLQLGASAPMAAAVLAVDAAPARRPSSPVSAPAVAAAQQQTVRKVMVSKGRRVVRNVPVTPKPAVDEAAPVPRTARFDMSQNGKRMTADEFDAWMKAQGIRVASGAPKPVVAPVPAPEPAPANCGPDKDKAC